jgi:hypothetical protein
MFVLLMIILSDQKFPPPQPLLIRVLFVLGNLTSVTRNAEQHGGNVSEEYQALLENLDDVVALFGVYAGDVLDGLKAERKKTKIRGRADADSVEQEENEEEEERHMRTSEEIDSKVKALKENEQVLIKLVRLLANMALSQTLALKLIQMIEMELLLDLLEELSPSHLHVSGSDISNANGSTDGIVNPHEELLLNVVAAIANFSFYTNTNPSTSDTPSTSTSSNPTENYILSHPERLISLLIPYILEPSNSTQPSSHADSCETPSKRSTSDPQQLEVHTEAPQNIQNRELVQQLTRILANLTRLPIIRKWMSKSKLGTELLVILLDHQDREVLMHICGSLINLLGSMGVAGSSGSSNGKDGGYAGASVWKGEIKDAIRNGRIIVENYGVSKLIEVMESALTNTGDLELAEVSGKALGNLMKVEEMSRGEFGFSGGLGGVGNRGEELDELDCWFDIEEEERLGMLLLKFLGKSTKRRIDDFNLTLNYNRLR